MTSSGTNIGYAMLPVALSFEGIVGNLSRQLGVPLRDAGRSAGQDAGQAIASGVEQARGKVDAATTKVAAALKKVEDQTGKVRVAEAQYQALLDRGVTDAGRLAQARERIAAAERNVIQAENAHTNSLGSLERAQRELNRAQEAGEESGRGFAGSLSDMGDRAGGAIGNLKNLAVAAAGIGSAMEIATAAMDFEGAAAAMNASLGATGALAEEYGKAAADLYGKGFGDSMADVTKAVEAVATTFPTIGFEGEVALDKAAERALNLAKVFDIDVAEAAQTASQLITNGMASDSTQAMDLLTAAMQRVPLAMRGELPEVLNEYGKHFQTFGLTGESALGLIVDMAPQGTIALDKTGDAIKELSIRATDGSKLTTGAFEAIGVDGAKMANDIAQGGPAAGAAMQEIARGLLTIQDPAARAQNAIALFGTPLEDLGVDQIPQFLTALSGASGSMSETAGAADQLGATLNDTAEAKLAAFGRGVQAALVEGLGNSIGFIQENKQLLTDLGIAAGITGGALLVMAGPAVLSAIQGAVVASRSWAVAQAALNVVMNLNPIGLIVTAIAALVAGIVVAYRNSETFRNIVQGAWNAIKVAAEAVVSWFTDTAWPFLQRAWEGIGAGWSWLVTKAQEVWTGIRDRFTGMVDWFRGLPGAIADAARGMWEGLKAGLVAVLNWISDKWNAFADGLSFHIPGTDIDVSVPKMPRFSDGGFTGNVPIDQIAGVVHGAEYVVKASSRERIENAYPGLLDYMNANGRLPLPGFKDGGFVPPDVAAAQSLEGTPYSQAKRYDCSGTVARVINNTLGQPNSGLMTTKNAEEWLAERGFVPGVGGPGTISVGWYDRGPNPNDGHMAMTLSNGQNAEAGGSVGEFTIGGGAAGADDPQFDQQMHLPTVYGEGPATSGSASPFAGGSAAAAMTGAAASTSSAPSGGSSSGSSGGGSSAGSSITLPTSISGIASLLDGLGVKTKVTADSPERSLDLGKVASSAIGGQVSSALGVFGVPDSPGWLQGISKFVGGISISGGQDGGFGSAAPAAAATVIDGVGGAGAAENMHGTRAGAQPGPGVTYNITARDTEDAFIRAQQQERERVAAKLTRY